MPHKPIKTSHLTLIPTPRSSHNHAVFEFPPPPPSSSSSSSLSSSRPITVTLPPSSSEDAYHSGVYAHRTSVERLSVDKGRLRVIRKRGRRQREAIVVGAGEEIKLDVGESWGWEKEDVGEETVIRVEWEGDDYHLELYYRTLLSYLATNAPPPPLPPTASSSPSDASSSPSPDFSSYLSHFSTQLSILRIQAHANIYPSDLPYLSLIWLPWLLWLIRLWDEVSGGGREKCWQREWTPEWIWRREVEGRGGHKIKAG